MNNFEELALSPVLMQALEKLNFATPTVIQAKAIPLALQGKDILGSAQTGTGKTLAFTLPLINNLLDSPENIGLILTPTRELAQQVNYNVKQLLANIPSIKTALLIGGESYDKQLTQLKNKPRIIIGTPGRIIDHLERNRFNPRTVSFLVLDETDRMLDMGFSEQLEEIAKQLAEERQTLMFSATFPPRVEKLAAKYTKEPARIFTNESSSLGMVAQNLTQEIVEINESDKYFELLTQLSSREGTVLIFVKTKSDADHLAYKLQEEGHDTCAIHGNLNQNKRERVMRAFRQGKHKIMVATDIAARGLDVPHVLHVINYDIPHAPEDYIHRIGRTARAGAKGFSLSFVSPQDRKRWYAIQELIEPDKYKADRKASSNNGRNTNPRSRRMSSQRDFSESNSRSRFSKDKSRREPQSDRFRSAASDNNFKNNNRENFSANNDVRFRPRRNSQENLKGGFFENKPSRDSRENFKGDFSEARPRRSGPRDNSRGGFSEDRKRDFRGNFSEDKKRDFKGGGFSSEGRKRDFKGEGSEDRKKEFQGSNPRRKTSETRSPRNGSQGNFRGNFSEDKPRNFQGGFSKGKSQTDFQEANTKPRTRKTRKIN